MSREYIHVYVCVCACIYIYICTYTYTVRLLFNCYSVFFCQEFPVPMNHFVWGGFKIGFKLMPRAKRLDGLLHSGTQALSRRRGVERCRVFDRNQHAVHESTSQHKKGVVKLNDAPIYSNTDLERCGWRHPRSQRSRARGGPTKPRAFDEIWHVKAHPKLNCWEV